MNGPSPTNTSNTPSSNFPPEGEPEKSTEKNIPSHAHSSSGSHKNLEERTKKPLNGQPADLTQRDSAPPAMPDSGQDHFKEIPDSLKSEAKNLVNEKIKHLNFQDQLNLSNSAANALNECLQQLTNDPDNFLDWVDKLPEVDFYVTFKASKNQEAFQLYPLKEAAKALFTENRQLLTNQLKIAANTMQNWAPSDSSVRFTQTVLTDKEEKLKKQFETFDRQVEQYRRDHAIKSNLRELQNIYSDVLFDENERKRHNKEEVSVQAAMDGQVVINAYKEAGAKHP